MPSPPGPALAVLGDELGEARAAGWRHIETEVVAPPLLDLGLLQCLADCRLELGQIGSGVPAGAPMPYHEVAT